MSSFAIPVMRPQLPSVLNVIPFLQEMDSRRIYSNWGPLVRRLESEYATFFKIEESRVVALSNATQAISGCIQLCEDINTWVIPEFTFSATGLAVRQSARQAISFDVDPFLFEINSDSHNLLLSHGRQQKRKNDWGELGLLHVLPFGKGTDLKDFESLRFVILDAAASIGAPIKNISSLRENHFIVFSLHATKVFGAGEGAIVICGSQRSAKRLRRWANFGFDEARISNSIGTNSKMSEISAAYALAAYNQKDIEITDWASALKKINDITDKLSWKSAVTSYKGIRPYWIAQFRNEEERDLVQRTLLEQSIESRRWWPALMSESPGIKANLYGNNKGSKFAVNTTLGLPLWRDIPHSHLDLITNSISEVIE